MRSKISPILRLVTALTALVPLASGCTLPSPCATNIVVTRMDDVAGGSCTAASCSLRQAVTYSNTCAGLQNIDIPIGSYVLSLTGTREDGNLTGDLDIIDSVNITGSGRTTIDGNTTDRVLDIQPGATATLNRLWITNGYGDFGNPGAGIHNAGTLIATNVVIASNRFTIGSNGGAGVYNQGVATISNSAIVFNQSDEGGGGITNVGPSLNLDNVTISENRGYGIFTAGGHVLISFSTIAGNYPSVQLWNTGSGGGSPDNVRIDDSIISGSSGDGNCYAAVSSLGFNLDSAPPGSSGDRSCALSGPNDLVGVDPRLGVPSINGGDTYTQFLSPDSPAIDTASSAGCPTTDQRGVLRPQGPGCDRGAFETSGLIASMPEPTSTTAASIAASATPEPTASATPTAAIPSIVLVQNAFCRKGPASAYKDVTAFEKGQKLQIDGRNQDLPRWWRVLIPNSKERCWISDATGATSGDTEDVQIVSATPLPPEEEPPVGPGGPSAPAAPFKLAITARQCTSKKYSVTLGWNDNANNETGYHVFRNGVLIATLGPNATSYTDAPPGSGPYTYSVAAFDAAGSSKQISVNEAGCLV